jgi:arylsulfatase A-like enzyme
MADAPRTDRRGSLCGVAGMVVLLVARAGLADVPAQCRFPTTPNNLDLAGTLHTFYSPTTDCCDAVAMDCPSDDSEVSQAIWQGRKNIVLFVADDHGHCHYGFMTGECVGGDRVNQVCRSNVDCPDGTTTANCVARAASGTQTLRLNEPTCRYRQPPSKSSQACSGNVEPLGARPGDRKSFRGQRSKFPCTGTDMTSSSGPPPVPFTPHLDTLASQGAVFTRAHVGGTACKSSRPVMLFGKPHRHLREWAPSPPSNTGYSIAWWLRNGTPLTSPPANPPGKSWTGWAEYRSFLVGKGEVLDQHQAGFDSGLEDAKTKTAKFHCDNGSLCRSAMNEDWPKIPWEVRHGRHTDGIGDALAAVFGVYRLEFGGSNQQHVVVRDYKGSVSQFSCAQCWPNEDGNPLPPANAECANCTSTLDHPFFLWYAPNNPHKHGQGEDFEAIYDGYEDRWRKYAGHITQTDLAVGALVDELRRHCVCGVGGSRDSLLDHTVILYLADHGFFLPNAKRQENENTDRTVLIVNEPGHRTNFVGAPAVAHRPFPSDLVHVIDLLPTILGYAGIVMPANPADPDATGSPYPLARDLKPWIRGDSTGDIRKIQYGEDASQSGLSHGIQRGPDRKRFIVLQQGQVGLCVASGGAAQLTGEIRHGSTSTETSKHVRPCFVDTQNPDADCGSGYTCQAGAKRCVNNPHKPCTADGQCTEDAGFGSEDPPLCDTTAGRCRYTLKRGSLGDVGRPKPATSPASRTCTTDADCRPTGLDLCQQPLLKIVQDRNGNIASAFDLLWDPDQEHDLLLPASRGGDPDYLGIKDNPPSTPDPALRLRAKAKSCLDRYWTLGTGDKWTGSGTCAWPD